MDEILVIDINDDEVLDTVIKRIMKVHLNVDNSLLEGEAYKTIKNDVKKQLSIYANKTIKK